MKKCVFVTLISFLIVAGIFAQSYNDYLAKAKQYESQKRWCFALGAYYDAMGTDELPENKKEAYDGYYTLKKLISYGNPGLGKYNQFTMHDEWKKLLIDAEQYGSSNNLYEIIVGNLEQGELDYTTKTTTYNAKVSYKKGSRYKNTIQIIENGYKEAYKEDWVDLPKEWPFYSVSSKQNNTYNVNGALIYVRTAKIFNQETTNYLNAFAIPDKNILTQQTTGLYDYKFNIVDSNGKELAKGKRWLLNESDNISFSEITPDVMDLIDNGEAFINPVACYLEYGKYSSADDKGGRSYIKNFPEVQLTLTKDDFICGNNNSNKIADNVNLTKLQFLTLDMIKIKELGIEILSTEVTQDLFETVTGKNPSTYKGDFLPVHCIHYDVPSDEAIIDFCNKLSEIKGLEPVYHYDERGNVKQDFSANGFRLPMKDEWLFAANGNEDYEYAGSNDLDEVGWYKGNSGMRIHPVAQKKANGFGLYDMNGNVLERTCNDFAFYMRFFMGGCWYNNKSDCWSKQCDGTYKNEAYGFRIVCKISE